MNALSETGIIFTGLRAAAEPPSLLIIFPTQPLFLHFLVVVIIILFPMAFFSLLDAAKGYVAASEDGAAETRDGLCADRLPTAADLAGYRKESQARDANPFEQQLADRTNKVSANCILTK